jgi:Zn-dependent M32 family carboxypeptidase
MPCYKSLIGLKIGGNEMASKITLTTEWDDQGAAAGNTQYTINPLKAKQFLGLMKEVNKAIKELQSNESLGALFDDLFDEAQTDQTSEEVMQNLDANFLKKVVDSFDVIATEIPETAFRILSVTSGVPVDIIEEQGYEGVLEVYEAVLEENDIEKMVNRVKKSLEKTQGKIKFLNLKRKATEEQQQTVKSIQA